MKKILSLSLLLVLSLVLIGCKNNQTPDNLHQKPIGVFYEIFVRSFADSDGNGTGDFNGIKSKLPYLQDLGIKAIWLMPINPSGSYHGYDVIDYYDVNSDYGTMADFEALISDAHSRGIKVIIDLVLNHSSKDNEWFIESMNSDSKYRNWYTWINPQTDPRRFSSDYVTLGDSKYFAHFGGNMPDLNFSNNEVKEEAYKIGKFWLEKGVDGFRLDAAPYIFASGETIIDEPNKNIEFWKEFRNKMRETNPDVYIVGEVWQNISVYSKYYQGLDSNFNFDLATYIIDTARSGGNNYTNRLNQIYSTISDFDNEFIDAPFLTNHDQDRIASQLKAYPEAQKLSAEMLLTIPGNPFIYYGEELGMLGVKDGLNDQTRRLPIKWGDNYTTSWRAISGYDGYDDYSVQKDDPDSLFNTYKRLINLRNQHPALLYGNFYPYESTNVRLQGFYRVDETNKQLIFVLHNFSSRDSYNLPELTNARLLYESYGKLGFSTNKILPSSTIIVELPFDDYAKYITK